MTPPRPDQRVPLTDELAGVFARMSGLLLTETTVETSLSLLSACAQETVPGATGAGVSVMDERGRRSSGSTDARVREADSLQYELDEGPCLDAPGTRDLVRVDDLALDDRWPAWAVGRRAAGSARGDEQPMVVGQTALGALKVYADEPQTFDAHGEQLLALFSTQAAVLVANVQSYDRAKRLSESMRRRCTTGTTSAWQRACSWVAARRRGHRLRRAAPVRAGGHLRRRCSARGRRLHRPPAPVMARPERASPEGEQSAALEAAVRHADLTLEQLWTRYFALGGDADLMDVDAHLAGLLPLPPGQRDMLAHAVNERLDEVIGGAPGALQPVPSGSAVPTTGPAGRAGGTADAAGLRASRAARLDRGRGRKRPGRRRVGVPRSTTSSGGWCTCRPRAGRRSPAARAGRDAGRARLPDDADPLVRPGGSPRLWVPLRRRRRSARRARGAAGRPADLYDPALREQCTWIASLLGHLIASMGDYGDELERPRRNRPLTASAELIWQQLPPLTAATDSFVLAGMLEPSYDVGGDAFDYALSERTVSLGIFDAMGHGISAALMAATALAGYRNARRDGRGVYDQAARSTRSSRHLPRQRVRDRGARRTRPAVGPAALRQRRPSPAAAPARGKGGQGAHRRAPGAVRAGDRRADHRRGEARAG